MKTGTMQEGGRLRNPLCVRWTDEDYRYVVDQSWTRRVRLSEMIRRLVLDGLRREAGNEQGKVG